MAAGCAQICRSKSGSVDSGVCCVLLTFLPVTINRWFGEVSVGWILSGVQILDPGSRLCLGKVAKVLGVSLWSETRGVDVEEGSRSMDGLSLATRCWQRVGA